MASKKRRTLADIGGIRTLAALLLCRVAASQGWHENSADESREHIHVCDAQIKQRLEGALQDRDLTRHARDEVECRVIDNSTVCFRNGHCTVYNNCCTDTVSVEPPHRDMVCQYESGREVYMLQRCPERWEDGEVRRMCERQDATAAAEPFTALPVTSRATNRTYSNYYCAVCHADSQHTALWRPSVKCLLPKSGSSSWFPDAGLPDLNETFIWDNLVRRDDEQWGLDKEKSTVTELSTCYLNFQPNGLPTTPCKDVKICNVTRSNKTRSNCNTDRQLPGHRSDMCAEESCDQCHIWPCPPHIVFTPLQLGAGWNDLIYTSLYELDIRNSSSSGEAGAASLCSKRQVWSPFRGGRCLDIHCDVPGSRLEGGRCVPPTIPPGEDTPTPSPDGNSTGAEPSDQSRADLVTCVKLHLNASDYELADNGSVYVQLLGRSFERDEYEMLSGGQLVVCAPQVSDPLPEAPGWLDLNYNILYAILYISLVCVVISVVCLLLHIGAFLVGALNRNLPGMCVTSLAVCVLIDNLCFIVSMSDTQKQGTSGCWYLAIATFVALIASMFWTNIMGFDVFLTLRQASSDLQVTQGRHLGRFVLYTLYVWVLTAVVVAAAVLADHLPDVPESSRPGFGEVFCGFNRPLPVVIFYAAPMAVTMATNAALFAATMRIIRRMGSASAEAARQNRKYLRLFSRLAVMMGLFKIVGVLAILLESLPLFYVFVLLYSLQGMFIFSAFTVTRASRAWLRRRATSCGSIVCGALCRGRQQQPDASGSEGASQSPDTGRQGGRTRSIETTKF